MKIDMEDCFFPEIKTEYDYCIGRYEGREYKLPYRVRQYSLIPDHKVESYKRLGKSIKHMGRPQADGTVIVKYYKPYAFKTYSLQSKKWMVSRILNTLIKDIDMTIEDKIEHQWHEINAHKTTTQSLEDAERRFLEMLGNYVMGAIEGEGILTYDLSRTIKHKEITTTSSMMNTDNDGNIIENYRKQSVHWRYERMNKKKFKKTVRDNVKHNKRWRNSKTYKMDMIFSYEPDKEDIERQKEYYYRITRKINPNQPYKWEWALVDTNNCFTVWGEHLKISPTLKQYKQRRDKGYDMDKIFVIEQNGMRLYYDQDINVISIKDIYNI